MMQVSFGLDLMTRLVHGLRPLWIEAGNMETALLARQLQPIRIDRPVFISGLARSGSTLLLEFLSALPEVATHQYRDFPFIFTPYFSRKITSWRPASPITTERAHGDRIHISPQSPEGMEEILWQAFPAHDRHFTTFYRAHIQKLLLAAHASRYVAKNNNLALRLPFLLKLFPDARIIVPVRDPVTHIGSLMRLHERFMQHANHPRAIRHLHAQEHREFGPLYTSPHADTLTGWIEQWNQTYTSLAAYQEHPQFLYVPYESLCAAPEHWLRRIAEHAGLVALPGHLHSFANRISAPDYYTPSVSAYDATHIRSQTASVSRKFIQTRL